MAVREYEGADKARKVLDDFGLGTCHQVTILSRGHLRSFENVGGDLGPQQARHSRRSRGVRWRRIDAAGGDRRPTEYHQKTRRPDETI